MREQKKDAIEQLCERSQQTPALTRFRDFHRSHPEVYDFLLTEVRKLLVTGRQAFSVQSLFEYTRWKILLEGKRTDTYKLNDHLAPFYGRALTILHPGEINGLATFRSSTADEAFGVKLAPAKLQGGYARPLQWKDGTPLEEGWKPDAPHVVKHAAKQRPDVH